MRSHRQRAHRSNSRALPGARAHRCVGRRARAREDAVVWRLFRVRERRRRSTRTQDRRVRSDVRTRTRCAACVPAADRVRRASSRLAAAHVAAAIRIAPDPEQADRRVQIRNARTRRRASAFDASAASASARPMRASPVAASAGRLRARPGFVHVRPHGDATARQTRCVSARTVAAVLGGDLGRIVRLVVRNGSRVSSGVPQVSVSRSISRMAQPHRRATRRSPGRSLRSWQRPGSDRCGCCQWYQARMLAGGGAPSGADQSRLARRKPVQTNTRRRTSRRTSRHNRIGGARRGVTRCRASRAGSAAGAASGPDGGPRRCGSSASLRAPS